MLVAKLIGGVVLNVLIFAVPLFLPAGTWNWWRAWVLIAVECIAAAGAIAGLARNDPGLLEERMKSPIQKAQPLADKIVTLMLLTTFVGILVVTSLDVFRLHLMIRPGPVVSSVGLALFAVGWWIEYSALRENAFAAPVVKLQAERHQVVIDTGPYSIVRHPMYAGAVPLMLGIPLWLESYAGALVAGLAILAMVARIFIEERFLRQKLAGYEAYADRVRYRLIPLLW